MKDSCNINMDPSPTSTAIPFFREETITDATIDGADTIVLDAPLGNEQNCSHGLVPTICADEGK